MRFPKLVTVFVTLALSAGILFVSICRAGLEILAIDKKEEIFRVQPIRFGIDMGRGSIEWYSYKIPEVKTMPDNLLYPLKEVRDEFWVTLSNKTNKGPLMLLMADKKIAEAKELITDQKNKEAIDCGEEALDKLKYSDELVDKTEENNSENNGIKSKLFQAGYAYKMILGTAKIEKEEEKEEYKKLINELDKWNEEQRKEKEEKKE